MMRKKKKTRLSIVAEYMMVPSLSLLFGKLFQQPIGSNIRPNSVKVGGPASNEKSTGTFTNNLDASAYVFGAFSSSTAHSQNYGQQPFIHTPPAGHEGLFQIWEQYARSVLGYTQDQLAEATRKLAEQEPYVQLMRALIRSWQPGSTYSYGDIVQLNGMTYQAEANEVRLISPDAATADGSIMWRPLVRVAPAMTLPEAEEPPVVMPSPDMPIDGTSGDAGLS